ncbi:MAG: Na-translocating system protein MpsC family protein [Nitrospiria bacterium]
MLKTKGQMEAGISNALIQFEKDYMGRGPQETKAFIIENMILVRLQGVLTPAEQQLAKNPEGMNLIKKIRSNLMEQGRELLKEVIEKITGLKVISLHTDISTKTGERMIIFTLNENLEDHFSR